MNPTHKSIHDPSCGYLDCIIVSRFITPDSAEKWAFRYLGGTLVLERYWNVVRNVVRQFSCRSWRVRVEYHRHAPINELSWRSYVPLGKVRLPADVIAEALRKYHAQKA